MGIQHINACLMLVCGALPACDSIRQALRLSECRPFFSFHDARTRLQKRRNTLRPIATIAIIIIIDLERRSRGDELSFQRVSNVYATAVALPAKS